MVTHSDLNSCLLLLHTLPQLFKLSFCRNCCSHKDQLLCLVCSCKVEVTSPRNVWQTVSNPVVLSNQAFQAFQEHKEFQQFQDTHTHISRAFQETARDSKSFKSFKSMFCRTTDRVASPVQCDEARKPGTQNWYQVVQKRGAAAVCHPA